MRNCFVFCYSVSADCSGMAASRFAAAGACVILLCFPAESRKSHCNGSMKVAKGALAADFFCILVVMIFLFKFLLHSVLNCAVPGGNF